MTEVREQPLGLTDQVEMPGARTRASTPPSPPWSRERGDWARGQSHTRCDFPTLVVTDPLLT